MSILRRYIRIAENFKVGYSRNSMTPDVPLSPSMEDYLETILTLETQNRVARVKDIAAALNVQMPSVTSALKALKERSLVNYEKNSYIILTEQGMKIAKSVTERHFAVAGFLHKVLCLPVEEAQDTACRIEHVISPEIARRLKHLTHFTETELLEKSYDSEGWSKIIKPDDEGTKLPDNDIGE